ncbi:DUF6011 domain-containing protein, partial [Citrobacter amalonaticus]|uniref:DUF6011 domain-containing protein n=1 Tax=Citrobacter amalonaticus TaxID=35703 RepID=UPI0035715023
MDRHGRPPSRRPATAVAVDVVTCRHCGRPLTDPTSRAARAGPTCEPRTVGAPRHRSPRPRRGPPPRDEGT